ncbi:MAG: hypothetical protein MZU97_10495 [Bacillus subtilis]|nr:hypothetical protein [Bacillus subtilis]
MDDLPPRQVFQEEGDSLHPSLHLQDRRPARLPESQSDGHRRRLIAAATGRSTT